MAYSDYQTPFPGKDQTGQPRIGTAPPPDQWFSPGGRNGGLYSGGNVQPAPTQPAPQGGALPTGTRQDALQQVQQAYAGRMPGQMDALNGAISNFQQPVGLNDPGIAPAIRAGAGADQRSFERQRAALAEIMGSQGLGDSGGFNTEVLGIGQKIGEAGAQRDAGLVYDEMGSRRNALMQALGMDQGRYQADNDLGYRLAALEAMLNGQAMQPFF
jgi:hypothetical protein